jgi:hypothetical protein
MTDSDSDSNSDSDSDAVYEADKDGMETYLQEHLIVLNPMIFAIKVHARGKLGRILKSFFDELHYTYNDPLPWIMALSKRVQYDWQPNNTWTTDEEDIHS